MQARSLLACALATLSGLAHAAPDLDALRAEIAQMKQHYESRLADLEARLKQAETQAAHPAAPAPATSAPASGFNPEMSLIVSGQYARRDALEERGLTGFMPVGGHAHGTQRGFGLNPTELVLSANVDPHWRGLANFAFDDEGVEVEEAWFQSLGLGAGLTLKGGRFLSGLGYLNEQHPHAWDFVDAPLMYQALFGEHFAQDGVQLKWLAPTDNFMEFGLEAGAKAPGAAGRGNGVGAATAFAHVGGDIGAAQSWRAGLAYLRGRPKDRPGHWEDRNTDEVATLFNGASTAWIADLVWKWAPDGNPAARNLTLQAEWFRRRESGDLGCLEGLCGSGSSDAYASRQSGWYAQAVYQFMPAWRLGARYDRLDSGRLDFGARNGALLDAPSFDPSRISLMLDWSPSEFSRWRLQYARDKSMAGIEEDQWTVQYIMSLGSHGAHKF
jgi:hypothetical protein